MRGDPSSSMNMLLFVRIVSLIIIIIVVVVV